MPFITLTREDGSKRSLDFRPEAITAVEQEADFGNGIILAATVHMHGICFQVQEPRDQILALIADAESGGAGVTDEMVDAARDEMARQTLLLDDEPLPDDLWADTPYEDKFKFTTVARMALTAALKARRP